jgi:hypothetical protein
VKTGLAAGTAGNPSMSKYSRENSLSIGCLVWTFPKNPKVPPRKKVKAMTTIALQQIRPDYWGNSWMFAPEKP